jgi:hypothetical protein
MIFISHRGNLDGRQPWLENKPDYIKRALELLFDVEIDVWCIDGVWFLGHDKPTYHIEESFLENPKLWCHAKNGEALRRMVESNRINCFWHEGDMWTLTSNGSIWSLLESKYSPHPEFLGGSIFLTNEPPRDVYVPKDAGGICSDYIDIFKKLYDSNSLWDPA